MSSGKCVMCVFPSFLMQTIEKKCRALETDLANTGFFHAICNWFQLLSYFKCVSFFSTGFPGNDDENADQPQESQETGLDMPNFNFAQIDGGEDSDDEMPLTIDEPDKSPKCSKKRKKDQIKPPKSSKKSRSDFINTSSNSNSSTSSRQPLVIDESQSDTGDFPLLCLKNIHMIMPIFVFLELVQWMPRQI